MAYFLEELQLDGIEVLSIQSCEIDNQMGEHGSLDLAAYIESEDQLLYHEDINQQIRLYIKKRNKKHLLFCGIITQMEMVCSGEMTLLYLTAKSMSYLMDIEKKSRSFQIGTTTYEELVKQILVPYEGNVQYCIGDKMIGHWRIQYEETDWKFLNRLLSEIGGILTPAAEQPGIALYVGIPKTDLYKLPYEIVSMNKDMQAYYYHKANGKECLAANYTRYQIKSTIMLSMFDCVAINSINPPIISRTVTFVNGQMFCEYLLQNKSGITVLPVYPMHMVGIALGGTVIGVQEDLVQVHLDIDSEANGSGAYWLPFSTVSAAADGTGWYCMPEPGNHVKIYFPCKELSKAIALNAVNDYVKPVSGEDQMGDVDRVYLSTSHGKKLVMAGGGIEMSAGGASIAITSDGTIILNANNEIRFEATNDIKISAEGVICLRSEIASSVTKSDETSSITVDGSGIILLTGKDIQIE